MAWIRQEDIPFGNVIKIMSINEQAMKAVQSLNPDHLRLVCSHPSARGGHCHDSIWTEKLFHLAYSHWCVLHSSCAHHPPFGR